MGTFNRGKILADTIWQSGAIVVMAILVSLAVNHLRPAGLPLIGDWSQKAQLQDLKTAEEPIVSMEEAQALFLTQGAVFIDARPADIYRSGHIQGALNLHADNMEEAMTRIQAEVPPDSLIITYCDGESCTLSKEIALELSARGYSHVRVLVNGWSVWQDANMPVESGSN
ncbi:MAG: rhodanese-like domain-containing protein [Syntrophobacteraceae bacterium]